MKDYRAWGYFTGINLFLQSVENDSEVGRHGQAIMLYLKTHVHELKVTFDWLQNSIALMTQPKILDSGLLGDDC